MKSKDNYKKYYTNSSMAHDIQHNDENLPFVPKPIKRILKKVKLKTEYKLVSDKKNRFSFLTYFTIIIVFAGAVVNLSLDAKKNFLALKIDSLNSQLNTITEENQELKLDISNSYDLVEIEKIASTRLNMSKPQPHQLIYVEIEKSDFISHGEAALESTLNNNTKNNNTKNNNTKNNNIEKVSSIKLFFNKVFNIKNN